MTFDVSLDFSFQVQTGVDEIVLSASIYSRNSWLWLIILIVVILCLLLLILITIFVIYMRRRSKRQGKYGVQDTANGKKPNNKKK